MTKTYYGHYLCKLCGDEIKAEIDPAYNPDGFPVLMDLGPPPRWGAIPPVKQHECPDGRFGVAEMAGWSMEEAE